MPRPAIETTFVLTENYVKLKFQGFDMSWRNWYVWRDWKYKWRYVNVHKYVFSCFHEKKKFFYKTEKWCFFTKKFFLKQTEKGRFLTGKCNARRLNWSLKLGFSNSNFFRGTNVIFRFYEKMIFSLTKKYGFF